jgi:hypothetical protein
MERVNSISFIMALRHPEFIKEFSSVVWAVYHEIRKFCFWTAFHAPETSAKAADLCFNLSFRRITPPNTRDCLLGLDEEKSLGAPPEFWNKMLRPHLRTVHPSVMARMIRQMLPVDRRSDRLVIIADEKLTPSQRLPYPIWRLSTNAIGQDTTVLSLLPLDPEDWTHPSSASGKQTAARRRAITKRRLRAACLSTIGVDMGLKVCGWNDCFMYKVPESVWQLDRMTKLGTEHAAELAIEGSGEAFFSESGDPSRIEEIVYANRKLRKMSA